MQKTTKVGLLTAISLVLTTSVFAADRDLPWRLQKGSTIIGSTVENAKGENLGSIEDLVVNPETNRVTYAVVSFGGFLGLGEKWFAIPLSALGRSKDDRKFVLNIAKEQLDKAPVFEQDKWPQTANREWVGNVYTYYQQPMDWDNNPMNHMAHATINATVQNVGEHLTIKTTDNQTLKIAMPKEIMNTFKVGDQVEMILNKKM